jgi:aspartate/methionine/tyrosine aminotransferase
VATDRIALTASTSEAYAVLFKMLCDPGDEVLVPAPSYPLFDHLTALDGVNAVPYPLEHHASWTLDVAGLDAYASDRTRAVLVVSPNNPTGHFISRHELASLAAWCRSRDVPIILDEVFADYELLTGARERSGHLASMPDVLGFTLGGLSKTVGLPQAKLAWIAVSGPERDVGEAIARLEVICDAYLSVSTPVQAAAAELLAHGRVIREQIQARIRANLESLATHLSAAPACRLLAVEAGWSAVLRVPSFMAEEDLVLSLLTDDRVLVHPGYFFDFPSESFVIVSLLPERTVFDEGVARLLRRFGAPA